MEEPILNISSLAGELIIIADQNDKAKALSNNFTLARTLEIACQLLSYSRESSQEVRERKIASLVNRRQFPTNFLDLTAVLIKRIEYDSVLNNQKPVNSYKTVTDFDYFVLQAFGETLSDIMWIEEGKQQNYVGPPVWDCIDYYESQDLDIIWKLIFRNYLANILVSHFLVFRAQSKERYPDKIEQELRNYDATEMVNFMFNGLTLKNDFSVDIKIVLDAFRNALIEAIRTAKKERKGRN